MLFCLFIRITSNLTAYDVNKIFKITKSIIYLTTYDGNKIFTISKQLHPIQILEENSNDFILHIIMLSTKTNSYKTLKNYSGGIVVNVCLERMISMSFPFFV